VALGARPADIARLVAADAAKVAAIGLAAGLVLALATGRMIETLLFQTTPANPWAHALAAALIAVAVLAAAFGPAWRASHIDPLVALRTE
jgi:putative ABC transport system permease protein